MITAIIRNKENTLVLDLPHSIYDIYEKLQSIGIMQPPKQIPLSDNEDEDIGVKLFSESDFGRHLLLTLNEKNSIADANMLTLVIGAASEDIKEELEQNVLYDQYDSMNEVINAVRQMTQDAGPVKAVFFCPLVGNIDEGDGDKASTPNGYYHLPDELFIENGFMEVKKTDENGKALAGAVFVATNQKTGKAYKIGPTNASGYAKAADPIPFGTYTVKETVFPKDYRAYGQSEWTVTLNKNTPNATITIKAVNELIPGSAKIVKVSEDGKMDGITFRIQGNGIDKTVKTANGGVIQVDNLKPGVYTVTETEYDKYIPQEVRRVTVVSGQVSTVNFSNKLRRGDLTVKKTAEDGLTEGMKFRLYGTSLSGIEVNEYAVTDKNGIAKFKDVLIGTGYTLEEVDTPTR